MYARFIYDGTSPALDQWQRILYRLQPEAEDSLLHDVWERARLCDEIPHFGNLCQHTVLGRLKEAVRPEIQAWLDKVGQYANKLIQPRDVLAGFPEFATPSAVAYFTERKQKLIGDFAENLEATGRYLAQLDADLAELEPLIATPASAEAAGMEDILLFPLLRNLTIVRGLVLPPKTAAYVAAVSAMSGVPLLTDKAV